MSELLKSIDARTKLAGTNKLEILLFSLGVNAGTGRNEVFGINVFKVREVMRTPPITAAPDMPSAVEGMVSLRGTLVPVIDLAKFANIATDSPREIMIVTEYNGAVQAFLVQSVDTILRLDWSQMKVPPDMVVTRMGGLVTSVTELQDKTLVMMLDVEKVLAETVGEVDDHVFQHVAPLSGVTKTVFYADDSLIARRQIQKTLDALGLTGVSAINGKAAWTELCAMADRVHGRGEKLSDVLGVVLTDVEMPEMDGYILTRHIKTDPRFAGIPVIMHSSLSGSSNQNHGKVVDVDEYVPKFEAQRLADALARWVGGSTA